MQAKKTLHIPGTHLGEGPVWDHRTQQLWWVDITPGLLHCFDPKTKENKSYSLGQMLGAAVPCQEGGFVLALQHGLGFFSPETGDLKIITDPEHDRPLNRFNDGKCDPAGRFWAGTMMITPPREAEGSLYCLDTDLRVEKKLSGIKISNGLAWTKDNSTFYYIDTLTQKLQAFEYDLRSGAISRGETVLKFLPEEFPDGMCIDDQDNLWIAFYGSSKVSCYNPRTGRQLAQIDVPAERTTSCAFGGKELDTLYITSAAEKGDPLGGALFSLQPGVKGRPCNFFCRATLILE